MRQTNIPCLPRDAIRTPMALLTKMHLLNLYHEEKDKLKTETPPSEWLILLQTVNATKNKPKKIFKLKKNKEI